MLEIIQGKQTAFLNAEALQAQLAAYQTIHMDIGTGDGRFVQNLAQRQPDCLVLGLDACRENLYKVSQVAPANALFVIANAQALPSELAGLIGRVSINFPWGSLLRGLLQQESSVLTSLSASLRSQARLELRLNAGALAETGYSFEAGVAQVQEALRAQGFVIQKHGSLQDSELKAFPSTWAKRLAFGRDPRATYLVATWRK